MPLDTVPHRAEATSKLFNDIRALLVGDAAIIDQPVAFTQNTNPSTYALTIRHKPTDADDQKFLLLQDRNNAPVLEIAALGGGGPAKDWPGVYIDGTKAKFVVSNVRNWIDHGDVFLNRTRTTAGTLGSFVPVQVSYETAVQPPNGFGTTPSPTNPIPDEVGIQCTALATNTAAGAGQNADVSLRGSEFICIAYQGTGKRSMAALTLGMHTAQPIVSYLDNPITNDDFFGNCGIILLTQDNSFRPGFGTNVAPNAGYLVAGSPTWKFGFAYLDGANQRLFTVDSGGSVRFRGQQIFEPGVGGQRINGDLSSATDTNRLMFTTTTANGTADMGVYPHGTARSGAWTAWGNSDLANAQFIRMQMDQAGNAASITTGKTGVPAASHLYFKPGGTERLRAEVNGNVCMADAGLVTTATDGFFYLDSCSGVPTGTPTVATAGTIPLVFDRNAGRLYARYAGAWHWAQFT